MDDLRKTLDEIATRHNRAKREEVAAVKLAYFQEKYPGVVDSIGPGMVEVNGIKAERKNPDEYGNGYWEFSSRPSLAVLQVMADLELYQIERVLEISRHQFPWRPLVNLFIGYWEQFYKGLSGEEAYALLLLSDRYPAEGPRSSFRAYLTTRSYLCSDGGAAMDWRFRDWEGRDEFTSLMRQEDPEWPRKNG